MLSPFHFGLLLVHNNAWKDTMYVYVYISICLHTIYWCMYVCMYICAYLYGVLSSCMIKTCGCSFLEKTQQDVSKNNKFSCSFPAALSSLQTCAHSLQPFQDGTKEEEDPCHGVGGWVCQDLAEAMVGRDSTMGLCQALQGLPCIYLYIYIHNF